jgi:hypothetical protein
MWACEAWGTSNIRLAERQKVQNPAGLDKARRFTPAGRRANTFGGDLLKNQKRLWPACLSGPGHEWMDSFNKIPYATSLDFNFSPIGY